MGLATAHLLASRGAHISLADINETALRTATASLPSDSTQKHMHTVVDVRKPRAVESWIAATKSRFGRIDGAVNMAGVISEAKPVTEVTDEEWDFCFEVNVKGVFNCLRAELRAMGEGGSIVSFFSFFSFFLSFFFALKMLIFTPFPLLLFERGTSL
jgi:NAD(P)-dependent dehydrogenase (short-subunit alcohol dehydrogenase family)